MSQSADRAPAPASPKITVTTCDGDDDDPESPADSFEDAIEFFEQRIWHNHLVCSNCFARVKRTATYTCNDWGDEDEDSWRTPTAILDETEDYVRHRGTVTVRNDEGAVVGLDSREPVRSSVRHEQRTTCVACGSVRAIMQYDTLALSEALGRVPALVDRLREQGESVSTDAVYAAVRRCKTDPSFEAYDKQIFAVAAALGVDKA